MKLYGRVLAALAAIGAACVASADERLTVRPLDVPPRLGAPVAAAKHGTAVYIVKLVADGAASYAGGAGFAATKPAEGERFDSSLPAVQSYVSHIERLHEALLASVGADSAKVHSFRYALNGFAATLTAAQASALAASPEVERIWLDTEKAIATNNSSIFLGLEAPSGGLRADLKLTGENVIVGVIDSGIAPRHPSLLDHETKYPSRLCEDPDASPPSSSWFGRFYRRGLCDKSQIIPRYDPPAGFNGICQTGDGFAATDCDNKIVGARYYIDGFLLQNDLDPNEFVSPKDADGHGTHIATTIAGNHVSAYLFGFRTGRISGIAPRARIAVYKACWLEPGAVRATCATSDLARAIDDAVADGVDIINYSLGSLETDLTAPDDLALLSAVSAGVLTVVAAGNDGPAENTIGSPSSAPWVLTVAASSQEAQLFDQAIEAISPASLAGELYSMREATFTPPLPLLEDGAIEEQAVVADDGDATLSGGVTGSTRDACEPLVNDADVEGRIVVIARGGCEFTVKLEHAQDAGAIAAIVYNNAGGPIEMNGDEGAEIPAVMIGLADGQRLVDAIAAAEDAPDEEQVVVALARGIYGTVSDNGNVMAEFGSRGPSLSDANFWKPDVTAPGIDILGGHTPDVANGIRGETYQYLSGTSQAAPEVAGVAALLKEQHPDWSPARLKSALMTTAYEDVILTDGSPATPFDMGSGHIEPNRAIDPGLVYDADVRDYAAYLCGGHAPPIPAGECAALADAGFSSAAVDVNLPSIAVAELVTGDTIRRRVTNVGPAAVWRAELSTPDFMNVAVEPATLALGENESKEFTVRFTDNGAPLDAWNIGRLIWREDGGERTVSSPIVVRPVALRAPHELYLSGTSNSEPVPLAFGYDGQYGVVIHGLAAPFTDPATGQLPQGFVEDDPDNEFSFRFTNGVRAHAIDVPPGQLMMRIALFDEHTDGNDDLDLYLFYCLNNECSQVAQSGEFTSNERIDRELPPPGRYVALVHGFQTDQDAGGAGANYSLFAWSVPIAGNAGNLSFAVPANVLEGQRLDVPLSWTGLAPGTRYFGVIEHSTLSSNTPPTLVNVTTE